MFENTKGVTSEDIATMSVTMRAEEKLDFEANFDSVESGLLHCCLVDNHTLRTVKLGDDLIAIYGLAVGEKRRVAHPWLALSYLAAVHPIAVTKEAKRVMRQWHSHFLMFENRVPAFDVNAIKLLKFLGFSMEEKTEIVNGIEYQPFFMIGGA